MDNSSSDAPVGERDSVPRAWRVNTASARGRCRDGTAVYGIAASFDGHLHVYAVPEEQIAELLPELRRAAWRGEMHPLVALAVRDALEALVVA